MTDGEGAMSYSYNTNRQLTSETRAFTGLGSNNYTFNYTYNLGGQLTQANYAAPSFSKNVNYAYNGKGALNGIGTNLIGSDPNATTNVISAMSYRAFGAASSISYGNNRKATLNYATDVMKLYQMEVARPDGTDKIVNNWYSYTENGLLSSITNYVDGAYSANYTYNYLNQLKTANYTTYTQDDYGNLLSQSTTWPWPATTTTYNYTKVSGTNVPTTNRLSSVVVNGVTTTMTYDAAGNLTAAGSTTYEWDAANRLKSVNSGSLGSYGYDGNGKRVKKTESGTTTYYVVSSKIGAAMEVTSAGVQRAYVMGSKGVIAQLNPNGSFYWVHLDHLGSGRKMTDASGNMVYRAEFDPYGKLLYEWSSPTNLNTRKFTGYERDAATNLDYAQARMYASDWGRFMSPDPLGLGAARLTSPKSLNRYAYVEGDPINHRDPTGKLMEASGECGDWDISDGTNWITTDCEMGPDGHSTGADGGVQVSGGDPAKEAVAAGIKKFFADKGNCASAIGEKYGIEGKSVDDKLDGVRIVDFSNSATKRLYGEKSLDELGLKKGDTMTTLNKLFAELDEKFRPKNMAYGTPAFNQLFGLKSTPAIILNGELSRFPEELRNAVYIHELFHVKGKSHSDIINDFKIKATGTGEDAMSDAITTWLMNDCPK